MKTIKQFARIWMIGSTADLWAKNAKPEDLKLKGHKHVKRVDVTRWLWDQIPKNCKAELTVVGSYHPIIPLALAEAIAEDIGVDVNLFAQDVD